MNNSSNRPKVFIMMPFDPEFDDVYNLFIADALDEADCDVFRADDLRSQRSILQDIICSIVSCDLIVADLTGANPNVFYELGLAHALRKPVILLTQDLSDIPFDLKSYRVLQYDTHFARVHKARDELIELAKGALQGTVPFGSPVTDFEGSKVGMPIKVTQTVEVKESDTKVAEEASGERGFLDHVVDSEEGFSNLTEIINPIKLNTSIIQTLNSIKLNTNFSGGTNINYTDFKFDFRGQHNITVASHDTAGVYNRVNHTILVKYSPFNITFPSGALAWEIFPNSRVENRIEPFGQNSTHGIWQLRTEDYHDDGVDIYTRYNESLDSCVFDNEFRGYNYSNDEEINMSINTTANIIINKLTSINITDVFTFTSIDCAANPDKFLVPLFCFFSMCTDCVKTTDWNTTCQVFE